MMAIDLHDQAVEVFILRLALLLICRNHIRSEFLKSCDRILRRTAHNQPRTESLQPSLSEALRLWRMYHGLG